METNFESIQILSESADWICVHKPALMLSVPSRDLKEAKPVLGLILQKQLGYQIYPVHRLDYEVSGLLIFAKNKKYQSVLNIEFENHTAQKSYVALTSKPTSEMPSPQAQKNFDQVYEKLPQNFETVSEFNWTCNLVRGKRRAFEAEYGKQAITTAKCIGTWIKAQRSESEHQNKHQI
ncbi:MAG: pseudouridine synthase, partial [Pseudobdellovibrionaceae bacterium]